MLKSLANYTGLTKLIYESTPSVLATVIRTHGSTPQKPGSSALIADGKLLAGTVGGGINESRVIQEAQILLKSKKSKLISFDLYGEIEKGSDSICGGGMTILLDGNLQSNFNVFQRLKNSMAQHVPGVLVTKIKHLKDLEVERFWITKENVNHLSALLPGKIELLISDFLKNRVAACETVELDYWEDAKNDIIFLQCLMPNPSLIIAGAGHISRSLAHLGKFLGFEVTVWDDRPEFATKERVPDADFVWSGTIDSALEKITICDDLYFVVVTHGHKNDAEVLRKFIPLPSAYLGMIGSRAKVAQMKTSFLENKWATAEQWDKIFTPIGLNLGGQSVEEIALSIAAQLVQVRNSKNSK